MPRALAALAALALAPALACEMFDYRRVSASPHVTVFQAAEGTTGVVNGNIVAVAGEEAILVVDTGQIPSVARRIAAELRALGKPVRWVVNTHWHGDHLLGNQAFREAFPEARFVAHPFTADEAARRYQDYGPRFARQLPAAIETLRRRAEASGSEDEKLWVERSVECAERLAPELAEVRLVAPDVRVEERVDIELGGLTVSVRHLGAGNTPGDLVVWVERDRLVASGDLVVAPVPYAIGSALGPWEATLARLAALGPATLVPGHGPVMGDARYLDDVRALIATTRAQLEAMRAAGVSREDAARRLDVSGFRARHVDTPLKREAFRQFFVQAAIAQVWKGDPLPGPPPEGEGETRPAPRPSP